MTELDFICILTIYKESTVIINLVVDRAADFSKDLFIRGKFKSVSKMNDH